MSQLSRGARAPDFELTSPEGQICRLGDALRRGPVVLVFFKSSCPTCQFTLPYIQKIVSRKGTSLPYTLWGISEDDAEETRRFAQEHGFTFDLLIDEHPYPVSSAYGLEFVPALFVVQIDGSISMSEFGFNKAGLNQIAGFELFAANDGLPAARPG